MTFDRGEAFMMTRRYGSCGYWKITFSIYIVCQSECIDDEFQLFHICKSDIKEVHMVCDSNEMILYVRVTRKSLSDDWTKGWRGRERLRKEKSEQKRKKKTGHVVKKLNVNLLSVDVCEVNKRQIAREHWARWVLGG